MTAAMFLAFILFLILSFPVAIAMGLSSCVPALIDSSFSADFVYIIRTMVVGIDSTPILAIPLYYDGSGGDLRKALRCILLFLRK